jgi:hypothetical protein
VTLVYRAVWEDDWCEPVGVLEDEVKELPVTLDP